MSPTLLDLYGRVSRRDLVLDARVWMTYVAVFAIVGLCSIVIWGLWPEVWPSSRMLPLVAVLFAISAAAAVTPPPRMNHPANHLAIMAIPVAIALAMVAYRPSGAVPLAAAMFMGTFTVSRLQDRRQILAHFVFGAVVLVAPFALVDLDQNAAFALGSMLPSVWVFGFVAMLLLEAVETQGEQLSSLVRRDPLTGVGNRRMLTETMRHEIARHQRSGRQFTLVAMDLNGFKAVNDTLGHDAGDELLCGIAAALTASVRDQDTVVRQGGDEFCVLLPETNAEEAKQVAAAIRLAMARVAVGGLTVGSGFGHATWPIDTVSGEQLLELADARLAEHKSASRTDAVVAEPDAGQDVDPNQFAQRVASTVHVSRHDLAQSRPIWLATGGLVGLYAAIVMVIGLAGSIENESGVLIVGTALAVIATAVLLSKPPQLGSWRNHVVVAVPYLAGSAFVLVAPEYAAMVLGPFAFSAPLAAARLVERIQVAAHAGLATALIAAFALTGHVPLAVGLSLMLVIVVIVAMAISHVVYLEAAEEQGAQLHQLVRRDPLTGLGNRRALDEQIDYELQRARRSGLGMAVITLDLNGFKTLNDELGHSAGDDLLRNVADLLRGTVRETDTVVRQGGDEFCVLLPETDASRAAKLSEALQSAVRRASPNGYPISTGVGIAVFPTDGESPAALLRVADERLMHDKRGSSRATRAAAARSARRSSMRPASN